MASQFKIKFTLAGATALQVVINGSSYSLSDLTKVSATQYSLEYTSNTQYLEVTLLLSGRVGSRALMNIEDNKGKMFNALINNLRTGSSQQTFEILPRQFRKVSGTSKARIREQISYGREPKDLVPTVKEQNAIVPVFYLTNRETIGGDEEREVVHYGTEISELKKGVATVNVPMKRKAGELNRPKLWKLEFSENPNKHFMILDSRELGDTEFYQLLEEKVAKSSEQDAFCFIHGYNNSFEEAVLRTAQIAFDIGFGGAPITFSWPSGGTLLSYFDDEESVKSFTGYLVEFFKTFCRNTPIKKLHIIAHSMGNRALSAALVALNEDSFFSDFTFNQIILAAPDIDAKVFLEEIAPALKSCAARTTLYASSGDRALKASQAVHDSLMRLGESGKFITCCNGMDTVDASKTDPSMLGHGYFASTAPLLNDIFQLFRFNTNPADRNLRKMESEGTEYWLFR